jgi:hypothetical protein
MHFFESKRMSRSMKIYFTAFTPSMHGKGEGKLNFCKPAAEAIELCRHLIPITRDDGVDRLA